MAMGTATATAAANAIAIAIAIATAAIPSVLDHLLNRKRRRASRPKPFEILPFERAAELAGYAAADSS